uniref:PLATZ transcription factor family protein n=1 Tax=Zea mays TaxID=4577 RepID=A0A804LLH9_MAIZE
MSCIGSSCTATNKGKETVVEVHGAVAEEKQQVRNGEETAAEDDSGGSDPDSDSESDLDSESDWDSYSEEEEERQQQRKKKEKPKNKKKKKKQRRRQQQQQPAWLITLLRTRFWEPCKEHVSKNRAEQCMFCLKCCKVTCPRCTHDLPGHRLLKIRRYVYRSVVHASDMQALGVDVSRIQAYVVNAKKVLHLRPMSRSKHFRPQAGTPRCVTCRTWLRSAPNLFCSLACQRKTTSRGPKLRSATGASKCRWLNHQGLQPMSCLALKLRTRCLRRFRRRRRRPQIRTRRSAGGRASRRRRRGRRSSEDVPARCWMREVRMPPIKDVEPACVEPS